MSSPRADTPGPSPPPILPNSQIQTPTQTQTQPEHAQDIFTHIRIRDQNGSDHVLKVKTTTRFHRIMAHYARTLGRDPAEIRFRLYDFAVRPDDTPEDLEMEDGDVIDCVLQQVGGSGGRARA